MTRSEKIVVTVLFIVGMSFILPMAVMAWALVGRIIGLWSL